MKYQEKLTLLSMFEKIVEEHGDSNALSFVGEDSLTYKEVQKDINSVLKKVKSERSLSKKINRLQTMQKLFKYWHVAHLPFALIMLVIVVIHIVVTLVFGYKWIF